MKSKTEQIAELQKTNSRLEDLLARKKVLHQDDYDNLQVHISIRNKLNKKVKELTNELNLTKNTLNESVHANDNLFNELIDVRLKLANKNKSYEDLDKMYNATHKLYMEEKRLKECVTTHVTTLSNNCDNFMRQILELEKTNDRLRDIYETLLLSMGAVERKLLEEKNKNRTLENELSLTIDANTKLKERIGELELFKIELKEMSIWEFIKWRKTY